MTQFSIQWILSLNRLSQKWGQVQFASSGIAIQEDERFEVARGRVDE
jgi:hypothetical protein